MAYDQEAAMQRIGDGSGLELVSEADLSTPMVSSEDGPRMSGNLSNFGGKKAAPFKKGGKRRAKVLAKAVVAGAKAAKKDKDGDSDLANGYQPKPYDANGEGKGEPVTCPNCGKGDAADAKFCDQCGFHLVGAKGVKVNGKVVDMSVLSTAARKALPASAFVFPGKRAYPIHDLAHAKDALARSSGKPEAAAVKAAVYAKYPALRQG